MAERSNLDQNSAPKTAKDPKNKHLNLPKNELENIEEVLGEYECPIILADKNKYNLLILEFKDLKGRIRYVVINTTDHPYSNYKKTVEILYKYKISTITFRIKSRSKGIGERNIVFDVTEKGLRYRESRELNAESFSNRYINIYNRYPSSNPEEEQ